MRGLRIFSGEGGGAGIICLPWGGEGSEAYIFGILLREQNLFNFPTGWGWVCRPPDPL